MAKACETEPSEWQIHLDPISHMPVTSQVSGITYRNLNCALCHQDVPGTGTNNQPSSLRFWYVLKLLIHPNLVELARLLPKSHKRIV